MRWNHTDLSSLLHHLPHSLGDLLHHEDKALVKAGITGFAIKTPEEHQTHRLALSDAHAHGAPPNIAIEKNIDAAMSRSEQNLGLLVHDYLHTLPVYEPTTKEAELLLEHWRKILLHQPQRLAEAKTSYWHSEKAKEFWQERIRHIKPDHVIFMGDWEHSAGNLPPPSAILGVLKAKQWQDLVIRNRLHRQTSFYEGLG